MGEAQLTGGLYTASMLTQPPITPMARQAAIYCRISRDREGAGLGVEPQSRDCRNLAERLGWDIMVQSLTKPGAVHTDQGPSPTSTSPPATSGPSQSPLRGIAASR